MWLLTQSHTYDGSDIDSQCSRHVTCALAVTCMGFACIVCVQAAEQAIRDTLGVADPAKVALGHVLRVLVRDENAIDVDSHAKLDRINQNAVGMDALHDTLLG
jgi:hypothetical protein